MNEYKIVGDYVVGYTGRHHNEFYFDLEDFDIVKNYNWSLTSKHDVIDKNHNGKRVSMKKLIMGEGVWCNKNGLKNDNRKANLAPARGFHNNGKVKLNG